jgi:hypothetical protein
MSFKEQVEKGLDAVKEASHRSAADGERIKREVAGDEMTPGEKVGSALNQAKETVLAEVDKAKRQTR